MTTQPQKATAAGAESAASPAGATATSQAATSQAATSQVATSQVATTGRVLPDGEARRRIREDLRSTLIVEAAAGTGKTTALVSRIVEVLRRAPEEGGGTLDRIVAVTFTEKAAGEMKLRLRAGIEHARALAAERPDERGRLEAALAHLEAARIGTIHSFCADLLREQPVEALVDPLFQVAADDEAQSLFDQAFDAWFQRALSEPPEGVRRILRRRSRADSNGPRALLRDSAWRLADHRDFGCPWRRDPFPRTQAIDAVIDELTALAALAAHAESESDYLAQNLFKLGRYLAELQRREEVTGERDHDGLEAELVELGRWKEWRWRGGGKYYGGGLTRAEVLTQRDRAKAALDDLLMRLNADLAACLHRELRPPIQAYEVLKTRAGRLDFLDLLLRTRDLLRRGRAVREELQRRFTHLFVDEFQDTDPLQAEILILLAADHPRETDWTRAQVIPGKLFVVGDPKQSIYRFRRADVALYEATKLRLVSSGAEVLYLSTSFRSVPSIQEAVNAAFAPLMQGAATSASSTDEVSDGSRSTVQSPATQAQYVALERFRDDPPGQPAIVALAVPRPYGEYGRIVDFKVRESIPSAVAAFIHHAIQARRWMVTERERPNERVPLEARHVCLLFKRFQTFGEDTTRAYVRALEARRIPHVLVGGRSFHEREEVMAVRNALTAIEWPDDELSVYATLRGPLFALTDDVLLLYRHRFRSLHPLIAQDEADLAFTSTAGGQPLAEVGVALSVLGRLHRQRNRRSIADTLGLLLEETRAHAGIAIWPTGEQALANVLRVMDLGRRFENSGATSFRAFVERLAADAERGEAAEAPVVEEGTEGVRIMTVHRAKGLEFPVVILADPTTPAVHQNPSRYVDPERGLWAESIAGCLPVELWDRREEVLRRDREESVRLAYVAATRARELLVVPAVGDATGTTIGEPWLDVLNPVLFPQPKQRRHPTASPGCPPFGPDSVLERPARAEASERDSVAPGQHAPQRGRHGVVWWDPHTLDLDREPAAGLRQQRILQADDDGALSSASEKAHEGWLSDRSHAIQSGAIASLRVRGVSTLSKEVARRASEAEEAAQRATEVERAPRSAGEVVEPLAPDATSPPPSLAPLPPLDTTPREITFDATVVRRRGRPRGNRFGTLVHSVLAEVELEAERPQIAAVAETQARILGATSDELDAAVDSALIALQHPLLRRAAESARRGDCVREMPVMLTLADGTVVEGSVDLAFREETAGTALWTVVDFKTDLDPTDSSVRYETQLRLYAEAIEAATGERAQGIVLAI
ncbi:UvrD-helicase domain-containing protein [Chondromyces crocatus]|uniref:DNA 3'-5' helicase n=1 Tax=Chondromyces crocatus TaxID=52 RepID=A0A0K1ETF7_CHOCO|nr:UvrD-helicase domain-containing protein [Chondromyces crocatus]AKT44210.1 ATP-dependent deoxyribonuclease subunit A [Chondromyces crocatus]